MVPDARSPACSQAPVCCAKHRKKASEYSGAFLLREYKQPSEFYATAGKARKAMPESSAATGSVNTQAAAILRRVDICSPLRLAAMVPATPELSTCVVLTGSPKLSAAKMVAHCHQFSRGTLGVGQMLLADLFANSHHNALPADHGAHSERQGNGYFNPRQE